MTNNTKAKINKVRIVDEEGTALGWEFDCKNDPDIAGISISSNGVVGLIAGYTLEELREISDFTSINRRRSHG